MARSFSIVFSEYLYTTHLCVWRSLLRWGLPCHDSLLPREATTATGWRNSGVPSRTILSLCTLAKTYRASTRTPRKAATRFAAAGQCTGPLGPHVTAQLARHVCAAGDVVSAGASSSFCGCKTTFLDLLGGFFLSKLWGRVMLFLAGVTGGCEIVK